MKEKVAKIDITITRRIASIHHAKVRRIVNDPTHIGSRIPLPLAAGETATLKWVFDFTHCRRAENRLSTFTALIAEKDATVDADLKQLEAAEMALAKVIYEMKMIRRAICDKRRSQRSAKK